MENLDNSSFIFDIKLLFSKILNYLNFFININFFLNFKILSTTLSLLFTKHKIKFQNLNFLFEL